MASGGAAAPFPNIYHKRKVADSSAKSCFICYKPVTTVLITPDNKDFFYICPGHLTDRGFAVPTEGEDAAAKAAAARKKELEEEIEKVKKEYEEKMKKRKDKKKKDKEADEDKKKKKEEDEQAEKDKDDKLKDLEQQKDSVDPDKKSATDDGPRIFNLHKSVYQMRLNRLRAAAEAKRTQKMLRDPTSFPAVPGGIP